MADGLDLWWMGQMGQMVPPGQREAELKAPGRGPRSPVFQEQVSRVPVLRERELEPAVSPPPVSLAFEAPAAQQAPGPQWAQAV